MRARRKGTNNPYTKIEKVQLQNLDILYDADVMEFEPHPDEENNLYEQWGYESPLQDYWQDVKERAAIAAMQGTMTILGSSDRGAFREIVVEGYSGEERTYPKEIAEFAIACADALIEKLKSEVN
jgi:hypothetical protein